MSYNNYITHNARKEPCLVKSIIGCAAEYFMANTFNRGGFLNEDKIKERIGMK